MFLSRASGRQGMKSPTSRDTTRHLLSFSHPKESLCTMTAQSRKTFRKFPLPLFTGSDAQRRLENTSTALTLLCPTKTYQLKSSRLRWIHMAARSHFFWNDTPWTDTLIPYHFSGGYWKWTWITLMRTSPGNWNPLDRLHGHNRSPTITRPRQADQESRPNRRMHS